MTGAAGLKGGLLDGTIMLNLDTRTTMNSPSAAPVVSMSPQPGTSTRKLRLMAWEGLRISVKGLSGGHSGMDIHRGLGNANKLMNRLLYQASKQYDLRIASIDGGSLRNAIPRESIAEVAIAAGDRSAFEAGSKPRVRSF